MNNKLEKQADDRFLAYRIYPLPNGISYYEDDLRDAAVVERVFDYAQILELIISKKGWNFLIDYYGYEMLFKINQKSGWFNCETVDEFKLHVEEAMSWDRG